jgi:hypothetical protein
MGLTFYKRRKEDYNVYISSKAVELNKNPQCVFLVKKVGENGINV